MLLFKPSRRTQKMPVRKCREHLTISIHGEQMQIKCECNSCAANTKESKLKLELYISGTRVKRTKNPKFLGVLFDRQLTFSTHARDVSKKVINRSRVLYITGTDWGYDQATLRRNYIATERTIMQYAGAVCQL